jgi:serine/threonine-protein kinase
LEEPVKKGITFFKKAIALDSTYALAYTGLGDAYLMLGVYSALRPDESFPVAKSYVEKALQLDPALSEAYATLIDINIHYYWDMEAAETYYQKAIALNPNYANAYHWHSEVSDILGKFDEAIADSRKALSLDPYNIIINNQMGKNMIYKGDMAQAVEQMQKTLLFDSTSAFAHYNTGIAFIGLKQYDQALHHLQISIALAPGNTRSIAALAFVEAAMGNKSGAKRLYDDLLVQAKSKYIPAYDLAVMEIGLGDIPKAMLSLEQAYKNHEPWMPFTRMNPLFSSVYGNKQFQEIVEKIKKW